MFFDFDEDSPKPANRKPSWAITKHRAQLGADSVFARKCALCPGTTGKLNEDGSMDCSNAGATPLPVTLVQAEACKDRRPPNAQVKQKRRHKHEQQAAAAT